MKPSPNSFHSGIRMALTVRVAGSQLQLPQTSRPGLPASEMAPKHSSMGMPGGQCTHPSLRNPFQQLAATQHLGGEGAGLRPMLLQISQRWLASQPDLQKRKVMQTSGRSACQPGKVVGGGGALKLHAHHCWWLR